MATRMVSVSVLVAMLFAAWAMLSSVAWEPNGHIQERHPEAAWVFDAFKPEDASACYTAPEADRRMLIFELPGQNPCDPNRPVAVVFLTATGVVVTGLFMAFRRAMKVVRRDGYR